MSNTLLSFTSGQRESTGAASTATPEASKAEEANCHLYLQHQFQQSQQHLQGSFFSCTFDITNNYNF